MRTEKWGIDQIPPQDGRVAIVTGANSGLGYQAARALALKGARVIMACRNLEKAEMARQRLLRESPAKEPEVWELDLASLKAVNRFALKFLESGSRLDLLINNAGMMAIPYLLTEEGFEMQFGVNHLGHFLLTASLWPVLSITEGSRVIQVSSMAHSWGKIRYEDINWEKSYRKWGAYGMSKLANLLFIHELATRLAGTDLPVTAAAAHPGYADTELQTKGARMKGSRLGARSFKMANRLAAQSAAMGALPLLYAATAEGVKQGSYYGPGGWLRMHGWPALDSPSQKLVNSEASKKLWELSEKLTGSEFRV
jgi:NAD(P)-dependent dehydrogenase (short-subunit alcohol dehydrogenase family)